MKKDFEALRILIVDDDPLILMSTSKFLKKKAEVTAVSSAEQALDAIGEKHYDLCFLDVVLPGMTGLDAMKIINERSPNTKVAIMTGTFLDASLRKQVDNSAYTFIEKPFGLSDIDDVVERATVDLNQ